MSVEIRAIRESERETCGELWSQVFGGQRRYFARYFEDAEWKPEYTQVAVVEGRVVSAVTICHRILATGSLSLTMGGIACVATLPEFRGRGYNAACLRRTIATMEAERMDFSLLGTMIHDYYTPFGYSLWPRSWLRVRLRPDFAPSPTTLIVRPATPDDLPIIRSLYDEYNRQRPVAFRRSESYWRGWVGVTPETLAANYLLAESKSEITGYVAFRPDGELLRVTELGVREEGSAAGDAATRTLLEAAASRGRELEKPQLRLELAFTPSVRETAEILGALEWEAVTYQMGRVLHRETLLRKVAESGSERWRLAGAPHGTITFQTPYGPTRIEAQGKELRVQLVEESEKALSQETLFGLLFGDLEPAQVSDDAMLHPFLTALFPRQDSVLWNADVF